MATPAPQNEVLVLASAAKRIDAGLPNRRWIEVQNLGPNPIFVSIVGTTPASGKARRLATNESWAPPVNAIHKLYAIASTADQVTGAATIVTELS